MDIVKYNHLTNELIQKFTDLLSEAFQRNEFVFNYLMGGNPITLRRFMKMEVEYNNHFADYYVLIKDDGKWGAVVIYLPTGCEPLGLGSILRRKKLLTVAHFFVSQPIQYTKRIMKFSDLEDKNWYKEPFVTLDVLASLEKGCGKALIEATIHQYSGQHIALNSSVGRTDHSYYTQFGFEPYHELPLDIYKTVMMIKKA